MITTRRQARSKLTGLSSTARQSSRRGITLLFTIGLITMFVLLGTTFLVVSVHYFRAARTYNSGVIQRESPRDLQRTVLYSLLRGTNDPQSSVRYHDLGSDMYERDNSFVATVGVTNFSNGSINLTGGAYYANQPGTGQIHFNIPSPGPGYGLMAIRLAENPDQSAPYSPPYYMTNLKDSPYFLSTTTGTYSGQYMTFLDGPLRGETVKIVDYMVHVDPDVNAGSAGPQNLVKQFIVRPETGSSAFFNLSTDPSLNVANGGLTGSRVLVNSRPFNGRGVGLSLPLLPADQAQLKPDALLPNRKDYYRTNVPAPYAKVGPRNSDQYYYGLGHTNETYDAVDYQNMILAGMIPDSGSLRVIPSFHRPSLVKYWLENSHGPRDPNINIGDPNQNDPFNYAPFQQIHEVPWDPANNYYPLTHQEFRRQVILRPMPWDHPRFSGSNKYLDPTNNENTLLQVLQGFNPDKNGFTYDVWDVDNDGDLIPDSIWIDVGLPVQVDEKGRFYKPLAAILCTDLDGRLNLNANGSRWHQNGAYSEFVNSYQMADLTSTSALTMRGQGYGPGEISLRPIFLNNSEYRQLLFGASFGTGSPNRRLDAQAGLSGRYGPDADISAGLNVEPVPGRAGLDPLIASKIFALPPMTLGGSYNSYADLRGRLSTGLDLTGNPIFDTTNVSPEPANSIYEMDLSVDSARDKTAGVNAPDQPFSPGELEAVLRRFDHSGGALPDRLMRLSSTLRNNSNFERLLVTTDSYDVPVPHESMFDQQNIVLAMRARLGSYYNSLLSNQSAAQAEETVNQMIRSILAPELVLGNRMDINRPFGNGQDDNGNGVIDEHWAYSDWNVNEAFSNTAGSGNPEFFPGTITPFDHDNNGLAGGSPGDQGYLARQIYARHLYVLMMLLVDQNTAMDFDGDGNATVDETPYALAQLAINIVDFRDADAIRTPFEFDLNPFDANGWNVDSILEESDPNAGDRGVVWGVERPELLITETFATHDRRTEDLSAEGGEVSNPRDNDMDMDQRLRPEGTLFLELYNPWSLSTSQNAELNANFNANPGVDLKKLDYLTGTTPVWRIMIAKPDGDPESSNNWELAPNSPYLDPDPIANATQAGSSARNLQMNSANIERTIYFTDAPLPTGDPEFLASSGPRIFQPTTDVANALGPVPPLGYAVLGPQGRQLSATEYVTPFGRRFDADETMPDFKYEETRSIWLNPGVSVRRIQPSLNDPSSMHEVTRTAVAIPIPYLSISEPTDVSQDPNGLDPYYTPDFDYNLAGGEGAFNNVLGTPLDEQVDAPIQGLDDRTYRGFRIAHLQRLANPLVPFDAVTNPYLTIDSAHIDLTIFHGVDPNPELKLVPELGDIEFATSERGNSEVVTSQAPQVSRNLWATETRWFPVRDSYGDTTDEHVLHRHLFESLGGLNNCWQANAPLGSPDDLYVGPRDLQDPISRAGTQLNKWTNPPESNIAFPWFAFNNRPFVSQYELTLVPKSRSSRVLNEFSLLNNNVNSYLPSQDTARYGHLANFFRATAGSGPNSQAPNLYRLFDFTHVPSKFVQAEQFQYAPRYQNLQVRINGSSRSNYWIGSLPLNTPFHYVTERREPGKVNINTIFDRRVWDGVMGDLGGGSYRWPGPTYEQMVDSRRGYTPNSGDVLAQTSNMPTFFANPVRDAGGGNLVVQGTAMAVQPNVQSTLFRSSPINQNIPLFDTFTNAPFNDATRSAYFKEVGRNRLANLVTTRSNVYAIWITLGYFEFDPTTQQLGQELGIDTGQIQRHRSFHIIDRSIPAGLQPGQNNNVDRTILVERFIE